MLWWTVRTITAISKQCHRPSTRKMKLFLWCVSHFGAFTPVCFDSYNRSGLLVAQKWRRLAQSLYQPTDAYKTSACRSVSTTYWYICSCLPNAREDHAVSSSAHMHPLAGPFWNTTHHSISNRRHGSSFVRCTQVFSEHLVFSTPSGNEGIVS